LRKEVNVPKDPKINSVLVVGSGPIVVGQACEFDYSGAQACKVLKSEGVRVVLVNSNPATIMTDPGMADATYVEPITTRFLEQIIVKEKPDALLATLGGQTALNAAMALHKEGVLERHNVRLIGADVDAIERGENREIFKRLVDRVGGESAKSVVCHTLQECFDAAIELNYPVVVRPSFTMGGLGSGIAKDAKELETIAGAGLRYSPTSEVLLEESIVGWKEYELEVIRDKNDNVVVVCTIENVDPMGVHTGDSITVAPALTLTDVEMQRLRNLAIAIVREVGVDTGGCNIQFAVNPKTGRIIVIEMNPRVSRSSALASKATGYPIAKVATRLAIGYTLDEIKNDITRDTPASFEPALDYVVVKFPRFAFDKFVDADNSLTTAMKSIGEAMAIGRCFTEALQKSMRSLEKKNSCFHWRPTQQGPSDFLVSMATPTEDRIVKIQQALRLGASVEEVNQVTGYDPWILEQINLINSVAEEIKASSLTKELLKKAKRHGFSDSQIAEIKSVPESSVRRVRLAFGVKPVYKTVDTCAAEFEAHTPYYYSSYDEETEVAPRVKPAVVILGSGPNRIGQAIEFDYSCVHATRALREEGYETIMINCNPETVSTDYDTADRLYFEPLTLEDVLEVIEAERQVGPVLGVIVSVGGQTPLKLASGLKDNGVTILGTSPEAIEMAEDRELFGRILDDHAVLAPQYGIARSFDESKGVADEIGYPVLVRPSFVLGGQGMKVVNNDDELRTYIANATEVSPDRPILVDRFLDSAIELDVDALYDGEDLFLAGIMEHVELAGVHSGDSACSIPARSVSPVLADEIERIATVVAKETGVRGLINLQMAVKDGEVYVLEANPRASRTVPFVSKATGVALAQAAAKISLGKTIKTLKKEGTLPDSNRGTCKLTFVKEVVLPWNRYRKRDGASVDSLLGPEMKSTGEVMGSASTFEEAYAKSQLAAFNELPTSGDVFLRVPPTDEAKELAARLIDLGFKLLVLNDGEEPGYPAEVVGLDVLAERMRNKQVSLAVNVGNDPASKAARSSAVLRRVSQITTLAGLRAGIEAIKFLKSDREFGVHSLQELA
jgi:carbamoyl-phosphate synthase large subunit